MTGSQIGMFLGRGDVRRNLFALSLSHGQMALSLGEEPSTAGVKQQNQSSQWHFINSGNVISSDMDVHIARRNNSNRFDFPRLTKIDECSCLNMNMKWSLFRANFSPIPWKVNTTVSRKLLTCFKSCLRWIIGIFWPETISNDGVHQCAEMAADRSHIEKGRKLNYKLWHSIISTIPRWSLNGLP